MFSMKLQLANQGMFSVCVYICVIALCFLLCVEQARDLFKETVNSVAIIRQEEVHVVYYYMHMVCTHLSYCIMCKYKKVATGIDSV